MALLDPSNTELVKVTSAHTPFYAAPDYPAPGPLRDDGPGKGVRAAPAHVQCRIELVLDWCKALP